MRRRLTAKWASGENFSRSQQLKLHWKLFSSSLVLTVTRSRVVRKQSTSAQEKHCTDMKTALGRGHTRTKKEEGSYSSPFPPASVTSPSGYMLFTSQFTGPDSKLVVRFLVVNCGPLTSTVVDPDCFLNQVSGQTHSKHLRPQGYFSKHKIKVVCCPW